MQHALPRRREPEPGGYHWRDPGHVAWWVQRMDQPEEDRRERLAFLVALLPRPAAGVLQLLDLGAGYGAVAAAVLARWPDATATLVDFSPPMMAEGARRLAPFAGRYRYVEWDLNQPGWPPEAVGPFCAVVSAQALHHLPDARKAALYCQVYERLVPGGAFVIWDPVRPPHPYLDAVYAAVARGEPVPSQLPAPPAPDAHSAGIAPLEAQLAWLRAAGFGAVDCFWKEGASAIFGGYKLPAS
ncbi:MAG TPA: class I SAM-dependent methyltransferase [Chloroflexota bacterium]|nr:class I SAM-dependent methyltransferase [Chloroflexota bacterium]